MIANTDGGVSPQSWNRTARAARRVGGRFLGRPGIGPRADPRLAAGAAGRRGILGRGARGRHDPRVRIYLADDISGPRIR